MPMISMALRLKIPVLQLIGVLAEFQKKCEANRHTPAVVLVQPVQQPPCAGRQPLPPPAGPPTERTDASIVMATLYGGGSGRTTRAPVRPAPIVDRPAEVLPSSLLQLPPPPSIPPVDWGKPINELQETHAKYAFRVKWPASADQTNTRGTWRLEKEGLQRLSDFQPLPCESTKLLILHPVPVGVGKQPPGPPPPRSTADAEDEALYEAGADLDVRQPPRGAPPPPPSGGGTEHGPLPKEVLVSLRQN
jgi:hypothetical protein